MKGNQSFCAEESAKESIENTVLYAFPETSGTRCANIDITLGGAAFSEEVQPCGWGGARNSATRTSDFLTLNQALEIIAAAQFAVWTGLPLNRHLTIHWEAAGIPDCLAARATAAFLTLARDWLRKRGTRFAWAWVRENGDVKGSHVHILLHCPPDAARAFSGMQRRWLRRITNKPYRARIIRTARVGGTLTAWRTAPATYAENLGAVVGYVLKGASPKAARTLGLARLEPAGRIIGKRAATSQNIGRTARKRH